jgi:hypothetical protein
MYQKQWRFLSPARRPPGITYLPFKTTMLLVSPAFATGSAIPARFTCQGDDINPELQIREAPEGCRSFVLIMDDPDAPGGTWDHWLVWNIEPETGSIPEGNVPERAVQGSNSWGRNDYGGPCPPSGTHRYFFRLYALRDRLGLPPGSDKAQLLAAMRGLLLAECELMGTYRKS